MLVPFTSLPGSARIWIYQASRLLTTDEVNICKNEATNFIETWTAHQAGIKAGFEIRYNHFIIIGVDENYNDASGCSIDKKVNFIKQLGTSLNVDFFNRMMLAYLDEDKLKIAGMHELAEMIKTGNLPGSTIMFNNLVTTVKELEMGWQVPVRKSWLQQLAS